MTLEWTFKYGLKKYRITNGFENASHPSVSTLEYLNRLGPIPTQIYLPSYLLAKRDTNFDTVPQPFAERSSYLKAQYGSFVGNKENKHFIISTHS